MHWWVALIFGAMVQEVQAHSQKFWFVKSKGEILEYLGKIPENLVQNS